MAVTNGQKLYCANNLTAMVLRNLSMDYPEKTQKELFKFFSGSKTYSLLYDFQTGLWKEGPDYLISLFLKEKPR